MSRNIVLLAGAAALAGCASGSFGAGPGSIVDSVTALGSDHSVSVTCRQYDAATGNLTDEVLIQRNLTPNAQVVAEMAATARAGIAALKTGAAVASGGAAARYQERPPANAIACIGMYDPTVVQAGPQPPKPPYTAVGPPAGG